MKGIATNGFRNVRILLAMLSIATSVFCGPVTAVAQNSKDLPLVVQFAGAKDSNTILNWKQVLAAGGVKVNYPAGDKSELKVVGYTLGFKPEGMDYRGPYFMKSSALSAEVKDVISRLSQVRECTIIFESIRVLEGGIERCIGSYLTVKVIVPPEGVPRNEKTIEYRGNIIEFARAKHIDTLNGLVQSTEWANPARKLNGQTIYETAYGQPEVARPKINAPDVSLADYLIRNLKKELEQLNDGQYEFTLSDVVIDNRGRIVYFENMGLIKIGGGIEQQQDQKRKIEQKIAALVTGPVTFEAAKLQGRYVPYLIGNTTGYRNNESIVVKHHKVSWKSIEEQ